jgi:hypothetical protein
MGAFSMAMDGLRPTLHSLRRLKPPAIVPAESDPVLRRAKRVDAVRSTLFRRFSVQAKPQAECVKIAKPFLVLFAAAKRTEKTTLISMKNE